MNSIKLNSSIALLYLFIAASLGIILRLFPIANINATYRYIIHTHSHVALLGWVYVALTTIIYHFGIDKNKKKKYTIIFWSTQITIIGMLLTFPFIGYALYSIIFSTLFIICSYWFYFFFKKNHSFDTTKISYKFISTALLFMLFSSIGPWALGIIMNTLGATSHWYKNAIYFYLHFQYNGWFIFCLIGIFFFILEKKKIEFSESKATLFYRLLTLSCIFTLFLSFLWIKPTTIIYVFAAIGAILQLISFRLFYTLIKNLKNKLVSIFGKFNFKILQFILILFLIKISMQALSNLPYFSKITYTYLDFVIGYLHLTFLGIVTLTILVFLNNFKIILLPKIWIRIYLLGFITSEILIFYKGTCIWLQVNYLENYYLYLVIVSSFIPISILGIFSTTIFKNYSTLQESL